MIKALNKGYDETIEIMAIGTNAIDTSGRSSKILIPLHQENTPPVGASTKPLPYLVGDLLDQ